ncbi:serine/threonine protein kinase [Martiniozyma asiatica (nom. inval.)]|nr:serine/threonine protein kinase [Martiniozyma asiatica]
MLHNIRQFIRHGRQDHNQTKPDTAKKEISITNEKRQHLQHHVEEYKPAATQFVQEENLQEQKRRELSRKSIERYNIGQRLGEGAFSIVYEAVDKISGEKVAIKVIKKYELDEKQRRNVLKEVNLMSQLNHPNIVKLIDFVENEQYYYIIQEVVQGGEIFNEIVKFTYFSEDLSRHVIIQVAEAILYMHEQAGIVHRDLKPENIFFKPVKLYPNESGPKLRNSDNPSTKKDEGKFIMNYGGGGIGVVKIGDFGLSKQLYDEDASLKTPCGTVGYTAPEIVRDLRYSKEVDMWALGCVLYILLCGFPPFFNDNIEELTKIVAQGKFTFLSPWWDEISAGAKNCVSKLLTVDPNERYNIRDFLQDPWIQEFLSRSETVASSPNKENAIDSNKLDNNKSTGSLTSLRSMGSTYSINLEDGLSLTTNDQSNNLDLDVELYEEEEAGATIKDLEFGIATTRKKRNADDAALFTPAVIAMKEAMDISAATRRLHEEKIGRSLHQQQQQQQQQPLDKSVWLQPLGQKPFTLQLNDATIIARRKKKSPL